MHIRWIKGRSVQQNSTLVRRITQAMEEVGVPSKAVSVIFSEYEKEDWANDGRLLVTKI